MTTGVLPGSYFTVRTPGFAGQLIRWGTCSQTNHAGIVISPDRYGGPLRTVEARPGGAVIGWLPDGAVFNDAEDLSTWTRRQIETAALRLVGCPYSWADIIAITLRITLRVEWPWLLRRIARQDRLICSQLVDRCYLGLQESGRVFADAGVHLFADGRDPGRVTPGDLLLRCATHPWTVPATPIAGF